MRRAGSAGLLRGNQGRGPAEPRKQAPQSLGFRERLTGPKIFEADCAEKCRKEVARVVFSSLAPRSGYDSRAWRGGAEQIAGKPPK